ncbi:MAG: hypothetical protein RIR01_1925 [Bacteroidota bacterium]|jgi:hypothetical protein
MKNVLKAIFLLTTLYVPVYVTVFTGNSGWLFMWVFIFFITIFDDDKDNGFNVD